jgi:hypothetical protein
MPARFSYFSYANFRGATSGESFSFSRSEQNLRWSIADVLPLDVSLQAVLAGGSGNDFTEQFFKNDFRVGRVNNFAAGIEFKYASR